MTVETEPFPARAYRWQRVRIPTSSRSSRSSLYHHIPPSTNHIFSSHVFSIHDMSHSSSSSSFQALFNAALEDYTNKTGTKLLDHPLAKQLDKCDSVESISTLLQVQAREFREFRGEDGKVMTPLKRVVHVLHTFSTSPVFGEGVGLVCPNSLISIPST